MILANTLWISLGCFAILSLIAVPGARAAFKRNPTEKAAGRFALWSFFRTYSLLASLVLGVIFLTAAFLQSRGGATVEELRSAQEWIAWGRGWVTKVSGGWATLSAISIAVAFGLLAYYRGKGKVKAFLNSVAQREFERVRTALQQGTLEERPPTPKMREAISVIVELDQKLKDIESQSDSSNDPEKKMILAAMEQAQTYYMQLVVQQHMNISFRPEDVPLPEKPDGWIHRISWFLMSDGLLWSLGKGGRVLYAAAFAFLIASLVGIGAGKAEVHLAEDHDRIENLISSLVFLSDDLEPWIAENEDHGNQEVEDSELAAEVAALQQEVAEVNNKLAEDEDGPSDLGPIRARLVTIQTELTSTEHRVNTAQATFRSLEERLPSPRGPPTADAVETVRNIKQEFDRVSSPEPTDPDLVGELRTTHSELDSVSERSKSLDEVESRVGQVEDRLTDLSSSRADELRERRFAAERNLRDLPIQQDRIQDAFARLDAIEQHLLQPLTPLQEEVVETRSRLDASRSRRARELGALRQTADDLDELLKRTDEQSMELGRSREHLNVGLEHAQASAEWSSVKQSTSPPVDLSDADRNVLREIAQQYELSLLDADYSESIRNHSTSGEFNVRSALARDRILSRGAARAPAPLDFIPLEPPKSELLEVYKRASVEQEGLRTTSGQRFYDELEAAAKRDSQFLKDLKRKRVASVQSGSFQRPTATRNVLLGLSEHLAGASLGEIKSEIISAVNPADREGYIRGTETRMYRTLSALHDTASLEEAIQLAKADPPSRPSFTESQFQRIRTWIRDDIAAVDRFPLDEGLMGHPASVKTPDEPHVFSRKATELVEQFSRAQLATASTSAQDVEAQLAILEQQAEPLAKYEDYFPTQEGAELKTDRGQAVSRNAARAAKANRAAYSQRIASRSTANYRRGRSFSRLRGFRRIGGVLIGSDPTQLGQLDYESLFDATPPIGRKTGLDLVDLNWKTDDAFVTLTTVDREGEEIESPRYPRVLAELALAYAADGRPTTVTMVKNSALDDWRIMLHPVLVDTPLGYEAIELDRFVDRFTGDTEWRSEWENRVRHQFDLYTYARLKRLSLLEQLGVYRGQLEPLAGRIKSELQDFDRDSLQYLIQEPELLNSIESGPLKDKTEFFDPELVDSVLSASQSGQDWKGFDEAILQATKQEFSAVWSKTSVAKLSSDLLNRYRISPNMRDRGITNPFGSSTPRFGNPRLSPSNEKFAEMFKLSREGAPTNLPTRSKTIGYDAARSWFSKHHNWVGEYNTKVAEYNSSTNTIARNFLEGQLNDLKAEGERFDKVVRKLLVRWIEEAPEYVVWSGVREEQFDVTLEGMGFGPEESDRVPLEFMLQIAFVTPPAFRDGRHITEESSAEDQQWAENYDDADPWQFPGIADKIQTKVLEDTRNKTVDQRILSDMSNFTMLQRLFRMAFEGRLGEDFPVNKLSKLHEDVGQDGFPPAHRTLRWHSRPGQLESQTLLALTFIKSQWETRQDGEPNHSGLEELVKICEQCIAELRTGFDLSEQHDKRRQALALSREANDGIVDDWQSEWDESWRASSKEIEDWEEAWHQTVQSVSSTLVAGPPTLEGTSTAESEETTPTEMLTSLVTRLSYAMKLRRALGIAVDDRQAIEEQLGLHPLPQDWPVPSSAP